MNSSAAPVSARSGAGSGLGPTAGNARVSITLSRNVQVSSLLSRSTNPSSNTNLFKSYSGGCLSAIGGERDRVVRQRLPAEQCPADLAERYLFVVRLLSQCPAVRIPDLYLFIITVVIIFLSPIGTESAAAREVRGMPLHATSAKVNLPSYRLQFSV